MGLSFIQQVVIAKFFGASRLTDAFLIAQILPLLLGNQFMQATSSVTIPILAESNALGGKNNAWRTWRALFAGTTLVALGASTIYVVGCTRIIRLLGGGLDTTSLGMARSLFLIMVPAAVLMILSGLPRAMLHLMQSFAVPGVSQLFLPLGVVAGALVLSRKFGIYSLALGASAGTGVMFVVLLAGLTPLRDFSSRELGSWIPVWSAAGKSVVPIIICSSVLQFYLVIGRVFATILTPGSVAAFGFSASIMSIPLQLFATSLGTVIFPRLSALAASKKIDEVQKLVAQGLRLALYSVAPFLLFFLLFPNEIVHYVLERGAFSAADTFRTAHALMGFAVGLPGLAVSQVAMVALVATSEWRNAAKVVVFTTFLDFPVTYLLRASWGLPGVTLATSAAGFLNAVLLLFILQRRIGTLDTPGMVGSGWRLVVSTLLAGTASWTMCHGPAFLVGPVNSWQGLIPLASSMVTGLLTFGVASYLLGGKEAREILAAVRGLVRESSLPSVAESEVFL